MEEVIPLPEKSNGQQLLFLFSDLALMQKTAPLNPGLRGNIVQHDKGLPLLIVKPGTSPAESCLAAADALTDSNQCETLQSPQPKRKETSSKPRADTRNNTHLRIGTHYCPELKGLGNKLSKEERDDVTEHNIDLIRQIDGRHRHMYCIWIFS